VGLERSQVGYLIFYPVIRYSGPDGKEFIFRNPVGARPSPYRAGDVVGLFYDPSAPEKAILDTFFSKWLLPFIFSTVGFPLFMTGMGLWFSAMSTASH